MKKGLLKKVANSTVLLSALALASCGGGGGGGSSSGGSSGGGTTSTWGLYSSPNITATNFVNSLNSVDTQLAQSEVILYADETYRSQVAGEDDWFVIYDAKYDENKAVSLQYIRSITYYDYYASNYGTADEFRTREFDDIANGDVNGDFWGDDYEVVDYDDFTGSFWGRNSGFEYEDEEETTDVSIMTADAEKKKFIGKAASISYAFSVNIETAMSLVTLGTKVEKMLTKSQEEMTAQDQAALMGDIEKITGASLNEMMEASTDNKKKEVVLSKIAEKIGTTAINLQDKLLPEVFGIQL